LLVARGETADLDVSASVSPANGNLPAVEDQTDKIAPALMNLEKDGLLLPHLDALFKKRAANFKRDRKAWTCTVFLPSIFVLVGFLIFKFISPTRDLEPIALNLSDYNSKTTETPINPIAFNAPDELPFDCQPGICAYDQSISELYYYCGAKGRLLGKRNCSISESAAVMGRIIDAGASAEATVVGDILEASRSLSVTAESYAASQYGALFFTHDNSSTIDNGTSYSSAAVAACSERPGIFTSSPSCDLFGGIGYVIQYNFTAIHVAPLFQTLADEALVREALGTNELNIQCTIDPLPLTKNEAILSSSQDAYTAWFLVVLSFPFIAGAFATFVVSEKQSKAKHLQTVAGVKPSAYWVSTYLWDVLNYQIPLWTTVVLMFAFDVKVLTTTTQHVVSGVVIVLFLFGPAAAGFTYCVSFGFSSPSLCNVFVIISGFLVGMGGPLASLILLLLGNDPANRQQNLIDASTILTWILRFIPSFNLGNGLFKAINIVLINNLEGQEVSAWSEPVLLYEVVFLAWQSIAYLALAIQLDKWSTNPRILSYWQKFIRIITCRCLTRTGVSPESEISPSLPDDDDVLTEQERVLNGGASADLVVVKQLSKNYDDQKLAVNNLSFGIPPGECFGLLGTNGKF